MDLRVTIKFLKRDPAPEPVVDFTSTSEVYRIDDPDFAVNNLRETILCLCVPRNRALDLVFGKLAPVRRVIIEQANHGFACHGSELALHLPALQANLETSACLHTIIEQPGIELRIEHADPLRRAGKYAQGVFPIRQHRAAVTLQFAMLQAVVQLGLDQTAGCGPFGPIWIMGFDTNNPAGHIDWPPHVHMHMALPRFGAPIGHYYFDEACRLTHNICEPRADATRSERFGIGAPCRYQTPTAEPLYEITISEAGGLDIQAPNGRWARIMPIGSGFENAAIVQIGGTSWHCSTTVDLDTGLVRNIVDGQITDYRFDVDTGRLTQTFSRRS